jgi:hypothetical protein
MRKAVNDATRPAGKSPTRPPGRDPMAAARASAAFDAAWSRIQAMIDGVIKDPSLTPEQRAAAIYALRQRQSVDARGARQKIMDEETANAKLRRRIHRKPRL